MARYVSPTGSPIVATADVVSCNAWILGIGGDGEPDYLGETEVFWETQHTTERDGKPLFVDENGEEWTFDELTKEEVE